MKTVMKKMFCLLLVAVMMVGIMPFAAFAETEGGEACKHDTYECLTATCSICHEEVPATKGHTPDIPEATCSSQRRCSVCDTLLNNINPENHHYTITTTKATCNAKAATVYTCPYNSEHSYKEETGEFDTNAHTPDIPEATCTQERRCTTCNILLNNKKAHEYSDATCTTPKTCKNCDATDGEALKHELGADKICTRTGCSYCDFCKEADTTNGHPVSCPNNPSYQTTCSICNVTYVTANGHAKCDICNNKNTSPVARTTGCHATADCPYCKICWDNGDEVKLHKTADHCETCGKTDGTHKQGFSCYKSTGNSTVNVHVRLYTSNVHTKTVELLTYKDSSDARIYSSVAKHDDLIRAELKKQYPGYSWSGNLYDNPGETEDTKETIGKGTTVYINAYTDQDLIYIYVHNSRSMSNLRIVQLEGKKVGETVTKSEVSNAVKKYFNVNSMSMYSEQAWEDYVDGNSVESVSSLKVTSDPYFIDVKISGSAKSSSGSGAKADSTNPKTGDAIFAPAMVLGLSASALVVLYYLNKKRAF